PPARPVWGDLVEQVEVREAHGIAAAEPLHHDVQDEQRHRHDEEPEAQRSEEREVAHRRRPPAERRARRLATQRTRAATQSRSVRRTRWSAPVWRSLAAMSSRWAWASAA